MWRGLVLGALVWSALALAQEPAVKVLADFEAGPAWPGGSLTSEPCRSGHQALLWADLPRNGSLSCPQTPADWSAYDRLCFWAYSAHANGQIVTLVCNSENPANGQDEWDYYFTHLKVDWEGWRLVTLRRNVELQPSRSPLGWDHIQSLSFNAGGWGHEALKDTRLVFDDFCLVREAARVSLGPTSLGAGGKLTRQLSLTNTTAAPVAFSVQPSGPRLKLWQVRVNPALSGPVPAGQATAVTLEFTPVGGTALAPLTTETVDLEVAPEGQPLAAVGVTVTVSQPLPPRPHPRLFLSAADIAAAKDRAEKLDWAKGRVNGLIAAGNRALELKAEDIPHKGGGYWHFYVCKTCGVGLKQLDPTHHQCPKCGTVYSGPPYDDVVISGVHGRYSGAVRDLGLAYAFTGDVKYAARAREILLAYADFYNTLPYHDNYNRPSPSGGRLYSQTLDESVNLIGTAWGYDLIADAPCLSEADRTKIEDDYLRASCRTIQRPDAGISNWQSWHNAGVGAVGFALDDAELAGWAINGRSGLRFQLKNSILPDGFWYEGTASYHFYALDALRYSVEEAYHGGLDFYGDAAYRSLYEGPLAYTFPNGQFPGINDGDLFSITGQHRLYELAYAHWHEPAFAWVASAGKRGSLEAFLWGVDELPAVAAPVVGSRDFGGLGAAVLRVGTGDQAAYLHLDYGPHGGGHGHPDKLVATFYALGQELAPDPGRLAYGAPLHGAWYRQTVAHNAVVVDGKSQVPTTGKLDLFAAWPEAALASASCETAYKGVKLTRTMLLTGDYLLDLYRVASDTEHTYDWVWHNFGEVTTDVALTPRAEPLGKNDGYGQITNLAEGAADGDWHADFTVAQGQARLQMLGAPGTQLYRGQGYAYNPPQPCPLVIARRQGREAHFASLLSFGAKLPEITAFAAIPVTVGGHAAGPDEAWAVKITRADREDLFLVARVAGEKEFAGLKTTARAVYAVRRGGQVTSLQQVD